jgi:hypothetical protein
MVVLGAMRRLLQRVSAQSLQEAALAERCIVVNECDHIIGDASKEECHRVQPDGSLILHRGFRFRSQIVMNVSISMRVFWVMLSSRQYVPSKLLESVTTQKP